MNTEAATAARLAFHVLGTTDDVTTCDLCGRDDLKRTIALQPIDEDGNADGDVVYYGSDCGARAARWTVKQINKAAKDADDAAYAAKCAARRAAQDAEFRAWTAFLTAQTGEADINAALRAMGGYAAAKAAYRAA